MNLRDARKQRNQTLKDAGAFFGIDASNLSRIERGLQPPSIDLARRMAAHYGMTLDEVFNNNTDTAQADDKAA